MDERLNEPWTPAESGTAPRGARAAESDVGPNWRILPILRDTVLPEREGGRLDSLGGGGGGEVEGSAAGTAGVDVVEACRLASEGSLDGEDMLTVRTSGSRSLSEEGES